MLIVFSFRYRDINITAVDIDPSMLTVATDYFGLVQDNRLKVVIDDGIKFLRKAVKNGQSFKAILFDVDSKDSTVGMSCPPVQFLGQDILDTVKSCIRENGTNTLPASSHTYLPQYICTMPILTSYFRHFHPESGVSR